MPNLDGPPVSISAFPSRASSEVVRRSSRFLAEPWLKLLAGYLSSQAGSVKKPSGLKTKSRSPWESGM